MTRSVSAVVFGSLLGAAIAGTPAVCSAEGACRSGGALLQTHAEKGEGAGLQARVATLSADLGLFENRVKILDNQVTGKALSLVRSTNGGKKPYEQYASLIHSKLSIADLTAEVVALEEGFSNLKASVDTLENEVHGTEFDPSLLQQDPADLFTRVKGLEEVSLSVRARIVKLEEDVTSQTSSLIQEGLPPQELLGEAFTIQAIFKSLDNRIAIMEDKVGMSLVSTAPKQPVPIEYASLINEKIGDDQLTTIVANLEETAKQLKDRSRNVENKLMGSNIATGLIQQGTPAPKSLESKLYGLWTEAKALEQTTEKLEAKLYR